jgi:sugar-specific transcriptional regulator TrmB
MESNVLREIGLTDGESRTYLALLKTGSSSTGAIAKQSQISRSKVYFTLDKLEKKGLVSHIDRGGVTYFQAVEPSKIEDYLRDKEEELQRLKSDFRGFLPELQSYYDQAGDRTQVKVYQGIKGLKTAHEHTYLKLKKGEEYCYIGITSRQPRPQDLMWQKDHMRRAEAGIKCRLLFEQPTAPSVLKNRNSYRGCDARYMPVGMETPAYYMVYKDTVMIAVPSLDPIVIEIVNQEIADSFKVYFEEFWRRTKPFKS